MARIAYYRVSTNDQTIESQRLALGGNFEFEFSDQGVSGTTKAATRAGFADLMKVARKGDVVCVYALDRLGRNAIDVQMTVRDLMDRGVAVEVHGLGRIEGAIGELIVAVIASIAQMERVRIMERTAAGRELARASLAATGKTHKGKESLGRPATVDYAAIAQWRNDRKASIIETAKHFGVSESSVSKATSMFKLSAEKSVLAPVTIIESHDAGIS